VARKENRKQLKPKKWQRNGKEMVKRWKRKTQQQKNKILKENIREHKTCSWIWTTILIHILLWIMIIIIMAIIIMMITMIHNHNQTNVWVVMMIRRILKWMYSCMDDVFIIISNIFTHDMMIEIKSYCMK